MGARRMCARRRALVGVEEIEEQLELAADRAGREAVRRAGDRVDTDTRGHRRIRSRPRRGRRRSREPRARRWVPVTNPRGGMSTSAATCRREVPAKCSEISASTSSNADCAVFRVGTSVRHRPLRTWTASPDANTNASRREASMSAARIWVWPSRREHVADEELVGAGARPARREPAAAAGPWRTTTTNDSSRRKNTRRLLPSVRSSESSRSKRREHAEPPLLACGGTSVGSPA